jgi:drug/metabolite transporter (DMT)-like permease
MKLVNDILTGKDNVTYDAGRVVGVLGALAYVVFWAVQVAMTRRFGPNDADAYGKGLGMVLLAMAGALAIKAHTEPDGK